MPLTQKKTIYLTFDDGPTPHVTDKVLKILEQFQAKATFFLVGKNAIEHLELVQDIINGGHAIGNHTHNHLKGWLTPDYTYIENMEMAEKYLPKTTLFRPPYGKINRCQAEKIAKKGYQIVMWDVLSGDFDLELDANKCFEEVLRYTEDGSIVVFHDSEKAQKKVLEILPKLLFQWKKSDFVFDTLSKK